MCPFQRFLFHKRIETRWVSAGQQALKAMAVERPNSLILDLVMPGGRRLEADHLLTSNSEPTEP